MEILGIKRIHPMANGFGPQMRFVYKEKEFICASDELLGLLKGLHQEKIIKAREEEDVFMDNDTHQRLIQEKIDLEKKVNKLDAFVGTKKFSNLKYSSKAMLEIQLGAMKTYLLVVEVRLDFENGEK